MIDLFEEFQEFRKILCICPCCGKLVRVSDLKLKVKGAVVTWLDDFEKQILALQKKEESFEEKKAKLREKWTEEGRKAAEKALGKMVSPQFKALKLDPYDIKPISNPVDFIVFKGLYKTDSVGDILFLSKQITNNELNVIRQQVSKAVSTKKYNWQVARIGNDGKISFE
jgi:predicted Holliday junction resolvase-like endonuclease